MTDAQPATANPVSATGARSAPRATQLQAAAARTAFGVNGTAVKVGIISDSFNANAAAVTDWSDDVATGDLPGPGNPCGFTTPVENLLDASPGNGADEGRAMAQVVHDLAPGAALGFEASHGDP